MIHWEYADVLESHWDGEIPDRRPEETQPGARMGEDLGDYIKFPYESWPLRNLRLWVEPADADEEPKT